MNKMTITFPDGNKKEFDKGASPIDIAGSISENLARQTFGAEINGKLINAWDKINEDSQIILHTFRTEKGKEIYWHSTAHIMAQAVTNLWPKVKVAIGPAIENGFYYDFDKKEAFTEEDLKKIEKEMKVIAKKKAKFEKKIVTRDTALKLFTDKNEDYKIELIEAIDKNEELSLYEQNGFVDLCRGPHIPHTGKLKAFKLLKTSGAYWRGDEKNKMLQRIYGVSFPSKKQLKQHLKLLEEAKKRDHRKLGKDLDLFSISDNIGPGLVLWHPNGAIIRNSIEEFWKKEHFHAGYKLIYTPHIGKANLWKTSGHLGFYNESMYTPMDIEGQDYYIKPMNCPFHIEIYNN
ncbi:MAG: threonine--tRNA ligase, partial [Candidatus Cloacimonadota bacterium]|nr:threonine--tRNA ligase [Candidatus Cloacimonadota bacterium]